MLLEHVHTMDELTDDEFGKFVRAYAAYVETGVEPDFADRSLRMMWKAVKAFDEKNQQKYEKTAEARSNAGKAGMAKRWGGKKKGNKNNKDNICYDCYADDNKDNLYVHVYEHDNTAEAVLYSAPAAAAPRTDPELAQIMQHFEATIGGIFPRSALDELQRWRSVYPAAMICKAMDEAAENGRRSWRYIQTVLKAWQADGVRTLGDVEARRASHQQAKQKPALPAPEWEALP